MQLLRSFVISKLKDYPQFNAVAIAIQRSGFKVRVSSHIHILCVYVYACVCVCVYIYKHSLSCGH